MALEIPSILGSIKKALGIDPSYDAFDPEITMHINSVFSTLNQLGVGPDAGYFIENNDANWEDYLGVESTHFNSVKSYMYLKTRLLFDPPATSFALSAFEKQAAEYEWRFSVQRDSIILKNLHATSP